MIEQEVNQLAGIHASVRIGVSDDSSHQGHHKDFCDGVLAQLRVLAVTAPVNVTLYKYCGYATLWKEKYYSFHFVIFNDFRFIKHYLC